MTTQYARYHVDLCPTGTYRRLIGAYDQPEDATEPVEINEEDTSGLTWDESAEIVAEGTWDEMRALADERWVGDEHRGEEIMCLGIAEIDPKPGRYILVASQPTRSLYEARETGAVRS